MQITVSEDLEDVRARILGLAQRTWEAQAYQQKQDQVLRRAYLHGAI